MTSNTPNRFFSQNSFYISYEKRKPKAREMVTLAVMSAIAVAARVAFVMIPHFKPMSAIIMITGMAFGSGAGFLMNLLLVGPVRSWDSNICNIAASLQTAFVGITWSLAFIYSVKLNSRKSLWLNLLLIPLSAAYALY